MLIEKERLTNPNAMQDFLAERLQELFWPRETLVSFEVEYGGKIVYLDVDFPEIEDLPDQQVSVNKTHLKLTYRDISETQKRKNYNTHIHAIGFRLIGEVFVCLPTVMGVVFSGYSQRLKKTTGEIVNEYLYSVRVSRDKWQDINFQNFKGSRCCGLF